MGVAAERAERLRFIDFPAVLDDLRADVLAGLARQPKAIPPKYFYDAAGCGLFEAICAQPEYALCRTEQALMADRVSDIAAAIGALDCIVEPGAGDCAKVRRLLDALHPGHQHGDRHEAGDHDRPEGGRDEPQAREDVAEDEDDEDRLGQRGEDQQGGVARGHHEVATEERQEGGHSRSPRPVRWM